eukprot:2865194-Rhodomonas_salina.1
MELHACVVVWRCSQNWEHVLTAIDAMNKAPFRSRGAGPTPSLHACLFSQRVCAHLQAEPSRFRFQNDLRADRSAVARDFISAHRSRAVGGCSQARLTRVLAAGADFSRVREAYLDDAQRCLRQTILLS